MATAKKDQVVETPGIAPKRNIEEQMDKAKAYLRHVDAQNRKPKKEAGLKIGFAKDMLRSTPKIPIGIPSVDLLLNGGIPLGKVIVIYGEKGVTKTNCVYEIEKSCIEYGYLPSRYDIEQQDDEIWINKINLDTSKHLISQENRFDVVWDSVIDQIERDAASVYIIDSLDTTLHKAVDAGTTGNDHMALTARKMSQIVLPKLLKPLADTQKTVIIVCQYRNDISTGSSSDLGSYSGGNALKHDSSLDLWFRRSGKKRLRAEGARFKSGELTTGFATTVKIMKSKLWGVRETSALEYDFYFGKGIDKIATLFETAWKLKCLQTSGNKYTIVDKDEKEIVSGAGYNAMIDKLKSDEAIRNKVFATLQERVRMSRDELIAEGEAEDEQPEQDAVPDQETDKADS